MPDGAPEVLLDLSLAQGLRAIALIQVDRRLGNASGDQGSQVERLIATGLGVADPDLDGAERVVRSDAPPELRRLNDRIRFHQELDEVRVGPPVAEWLVDTATWERPGEDLRAHRMQARVAMVEEWRVRGEGEQRRQELSHPIGYRHGPVGPPDPDMNMEAPGVVPLCHPAQVALEPAVMLGLDDVLVQIVGPGMGAHRSQGQSHLVGDPEQPLAPRALPSRGVGEGLAPPRTDLDLGVDQFALDRVGELRIAQAGLLHLLEPMLEIEDGGVQDRELLLDPDREVGRGLEQPANLVEVKPVVLWLRIRGHRRRVRSNRSRGRRAGRPRGSTCGP